LLQHEPVAKHLGNAGMESIFPLLQTERTARKGYRSRDQARSDVFDQLELQLEELKATAAEDETTLDGDWAGDFVALGLIRRKPVRGPLPFHLPRERVVIPAQRFCQTSRHLSVGGGKRSAFLGLHWTGG
jgi:hypothetical protein